MVRACSRPCAPREAVTGTLGLPSEPSIDAPDRDLVGKVADEFLSWCEQFVTEPGARAIRHPGFRNAWMRVRAGGASRDGERVLVAREYVEGSLDWHAFDECPGASLGATPSPPPARLMQAVIPTPVSYRGMPARDGGSSKTRSWISAPWRCHRPTWCDC